MKRDGMMSVDVPVRRPTGPPPTIRTSVSETVIFPFKLSRDLCSSVWSFGRMEKLKKKEKICLGSEVGTEIGGDGCRPKEAYRGASLRGFWLVGNL